MTARATTKKYPADGAHQPIECGTRRLALHSEHPTDAGQPELARHDEDDATAAAAAAAAGNSAAAAAAAAGNATTAMGGGTRTRQCEV